MGNDMVIQLKDIHFSYGNFKALDGASLEVGKGIFGLRVI